MGKIIDVNTTSSEPTHFLAALELIKEARKQYKVASENWPHPISTRIGNPRDRYYAEIWVDGMDWQHTYWYIESENYNSPVCLPFIKFTNHDEEDKFNEYDLNQLFSAFLYLRRNKMWVKHADGKGIYNDTVWSYFTRTHKYVDSIWTACTYAHASQNLVNFEMNYIFDEDIKWQ